MYVLNKIFKNSNSCYEKQKHPIPYLKTTDQQKRGENQFKIEQE